MGASLDACGLDRSPRPPLPFRAHPALAGEAEDVAQRLAAAFGQQVTGTAPPPGGTGFQVAQAWNTTQGRITLWHFTSAATDAVRGWSFMTGWRAGDTEQDRQHLQAALDNLTAGGPRLVADGGYAATVHQEFPGTDFTIWAGAWRPSRDGQELELSKALVVDGRPMRQAELAVEARRFLDCLVGLPGGAPAEPDLDNTRGMEMGSRLVYIAPWHWTDGCTALPPSIVVDALSGRTVDVAGLGRLAACGRDGA